MSRKHLNHYLSDFAGRHKFRSKGTVMQMTPLALGMVGKHAIQEVDQGQMTKEYRNIKTAANE